MHSLVALWRAVTRWDEDMHYAYPGQWALFELLVALFGGVTIGVLVGLWMLSGAS